MFEILIENASISRLQHTAQLRLIQPAGLPLDAAAHFPTGNFATVDERQGAYAIKACTDVRMPADDMLQLYLQARLFLKLALRCLRGMLPPAHKTAGEYQAPF